MKLFVDLRSGDVELVKDPFLDKTLIASGLFVTRKREVRRAAVLFFKDGRNKPSVWVRV